MCKALLGLLTLLPVLSFASVTVVQTATANPTTALASQTVTFSQPLTAGNTVVIVMSDANTGTFTSCSDPNNPTYANVGFGATTGAKARIVYKAGIVGGATSVACSYTSALKFGMVVAELSGIDGLNPFDTSVAATGSGTAMTCSTTATTQANNEFSVAAFANASHRKLVR